MQITGVSKDQTKNTMTFFASIFSKATIAKHGIDLGREVIYAHGGARRIEVTSSSPRTLEGNRPTFIIRNETHHWITSNDGIELAAVIRRNLGKIKGGQARALSITNAYRPGEGSVGETQRQAYQDVMERRGVATLMYDSLEAPVGSTLMPEFTRWGEDGSEIRETNPDGTPIPPSIEVVREHLRRILSVVRGDADWLDLERLVEDILSGEMSVEDAKRFYFNSISLGDDAAFDPEDVRAAADAELVTARQLGSVDPLRCSWLKVGPTEPVVIFGDGSKSEDSTGLIGCRLSDGFLFTIGVWQRPKGDRGRAWLAPRDEIDARVHEAFERFNVVAFWFDPSHTRDDENEVRYWDTLIDAWHVRYADRLQYWAVQGGDRRSAIMWDMTSPTRQVDFVSAVQRFSDELESKTFMHDGHPSLMDHLRNARNSLTSHGWSISKISRTSSKKIDLAVCAVGARMLRRLVMLKGLEEVKPLAAAWWAPV